MSNGSEACCAIGICCPPEAAARVTALAKIISDDSLVGAQAHAAAVCVLEHFDLAPKGTLQPLYDAILVLAKHAKA